MSADLRSCHTMAGPIAAPEERSQASTVSPWLANPIASSRGLPASINARQPAPTTLFHNAVGSSSTPPFAVATTSIGDSAVARTRSPSITIALVADVP